MRKSSGRVRIAVKLIDGTDGAQIWADRFEDTLEDVFALQDRVALSVAGVIEPAVHEADARRTASRPTGDLGSYDLYLRAYSLYRTLARADLVAASALVDRAIVLDPENGPALGLGAFCRVFLVTSGWSDDPAGQLSQARALVSRALKVGADDPEVLTNLAIAIGLAGDGETSVALADRAVELNPGSSWAWFASRLREDEHRRAGARVRAYGSGPSPGSPVAASARHAWRTGLRSGSPKDGFGEAVALLNKRSNCCRFSDGAAVPGRLFRTSGKPGRGREAIARFRALRRPTFEPSRPAIWTPVRASCSWRGSISWRGMRPRPPPTRRPVMSDIFISYAREREAEAFVARRPPWRYVVREPNW